MTGKKTDAWMPLWIGDYMADTAHLSRDEHGGYLLLLFAYWRSGGALPDDDKRLANIAKATPAEWKKLRSVLVEFFIVAGGVWTSKRMERELNDARHRSEKAHNKAKLAAEARWNHEQKDSSSNAPSMPQASSEHARSTPQAMHKECPSPSPSPISIPNGTEIKRDAQKKVTRPDDLDAKLWAEWQGHRKTKRAAITDGVIKSFRSEAEKVGYTLSEALRKSIDRGWTGFEADWVNKELARGGAPPGFAQRPAKFDPVAYVNQGKTSELARNEKVIDAESLG